MEKVIAEWEVEHGALTAAELKAAQRKQLATKRR